VACQPLLLPPLSLSLSAAAAAADIAAEPIEWLVLVANRKWLEDCSVAIVYFIQCNRLD